MGRLIKIVLVALGVRAFLHWRKRRQERQTEIPAVEAPDPADELKRKLAESRDEADAVTEPPAATVADRRAEVHDQGRAAVDEMKSSDES